MTFFEVVFYSEARKTNVDYAQDDTAQWHSIKWGWEYNGETASLQMTQDMSASYQALMVFKRKKTFFFQALPD